MPVNSELVARLLQPIRPDAPAGDDLRYDNRVDLIKEARREDLDLPSNNAEAKRKLADWSQVVSLTTKLLTEETKDLQLAAWLCEGLLHKDGYGGFATGLNAFQGLLDDFWESVYPLPEDGDDEARLGPVEWIGAKLVLPLRMISYGPLNVTYLQIDESRQLPTEAETEKDNDKRARRAEAIEQGKPTPEAVEVMLGAMNKVAVRATISDLDVLRAAIVNLEKSADVRFGSSAPSLSGVRNVVDEIKRFAAAQLLKKLEEDPDPEIIESLEEAMPIGEDGAPISIEPANRTDAANRLAVVAHWFRVDDPTNPAPYLMVRGFRWGELRVNAPEVDSKLLEAPATALRSRLKTLLLDGKWSELLEQSEQLMAQSSGRGWLDLQRYALTACANLGGSYEPIAAVIRSELRALLAALPQLSRMTLMDDTPTANEETREWIASEELQPAATEASSAAPSASDADTGADENISNTADVLADALEDDSSSAQQGGFSRTRAIRRSGPRGRDAFDSACQELALGRANKAVQLLMAELARDQSARGRLVRQTQIAYIMVEAGLDTVARPILQRLIETIDERTLEQWESGPLVAQPMALMCRILDRSGEESTERDELYLRVCRLDPIQALALQSR